MKKIFWFGSLLSLESLKASGPDVKKLIPAYIHGFKRTFSLWDPIWFTTSQKDLSGIWFCALDIQKTGSHDDVINGVVFSVSDEDFECIKVREQEYDIVSIECFDFKTQQSLWEHFFFSANKNNGEYKKWCLAQKRYLEVCLDWAKEHGELFYEQFLKTTYIGSETLQEWL